jgi:ABC-type branched-subunit amino acid transport system ATPase component
METINIPERPFDLKLLPNTGSTIAIIGTSKAGKTTLMKYIYKTYFKDFITVMFSLNTHAEIYRDIGKDVILFDHYEPFVFKSAHAINKAHKNKFDFFMITDDIIGSKLKNDPQITRAMTVLRNCGITTLQSLQDATLLSCVGRNNANYIMIFKQITPRKMMEVIDEFLLSYFPSTMRKREILEYCMDTLSEKGRFFFIDNVHSTIQLCKLTQEQINA